MDKTHQLLAEYVNCASDLADAVREAVRKDAKINNKIVLALNAFIIAANNIQDLTNELQKINTKLN